MSYFFYTKSQ